MSKPIIKHKAHASRPRPFIIPVFLPHAGCPHRCVFCDQHQTTGATSAMPAIADMKTAITQFLSYRRDRSRWTEISFYGGNFLGLTHGEIHDLLSLAADHVHSGEVDGIRFSTRPDTIDPDRLAMLTGFPITTIEIGVQSMNDEVLALNGRGHKAGDTRNAVALIRKLTGCRLGLQVMIGMAGDSPDHVLHTTRRLIEMAPDFVRIYPLLVLRGSMLEHWYHQGRYRPLELGKAVAQAKTMVRHLAAAGIPIVRIGLQPTAELNPQAGVLAGPFHPAFGELVRAAAWRETIGDHLIHCDHRTDPLLIRTHPRCLSQVRGQKNENIAYWREQFRLESIDVRADAAIPPDTAAIDGRYCRIGVKEF